MTTTANLVSKPFQFANGLTLKNRVVMAPMTTWSAEADGKVSEQELQYYRARANGAGMIISGCSPVTPSGIGFTDEFAVWHDKYVVSLTKLASATQSGGAVSVLQLFHAGNKAVANLVPDADVVSASESIAAKGPFNDGVTQSRELRDAEILAIIDAFGDATRRAIAAGFDGVELHGAHGFLLQNFLSPQFNRRNDDWGGTAEKRMAFPLAVIRKVQDVIKQHAKTPFVLGYRISLEEQEAKGLRLADSLAFIEQLIKQQVSYLHVSLKDVQTDRPIGDTSGVSTVSQLLEHVDNRIPVIAAGKITLPEQAEAALTAGLDLVAIGRGLVMNPRWAEIASGETPGAIVTSMSVKNRDALSIPDKLWDIILSTQDWFKLEAV